MPNLTEQERNYLRSWLGPFQDYIRDELYRPLQNEIYPYANPSEITGLNEEIQHLANEVGQGHGAITISDDRIPIIKLIVLTLRRETASRLEVPRQRTFHPDLLRTLDNQLDPFKSFLEKDWFIRGPFYTMPRLSDFLTLDRVAAILAQQLSFADRVYDEKFHILQAPQLVITDINYYRGHCALRGNSVIVAYLDIDNFKSFNSKHGETKIDRDLLPVFMKYLEAFVFARGHAYRYGGDEYMLLLPNMDQVAAVQDLDRLREEVKRLPFAGIEEKTQISMGFCIADPDCFLTDRELEQRAERAKNHAKGNGRDCIAMYNGRLFRDEDLRILPKKT